MYSDILLNIFMVNYRIWPLLLLTAVTHLHSLVKKTQLLIETFNLLTSSRDTCSVSYHQRKGQSHA